MGKPSPVTVLSHCVSLLSATEKTPPPLMWHCVTRPQRSKNLPLVNSYRVHSRMLEKALSETRVKVRGGGEWALCLCVGWGGGVVFGDLAQVITAASGFFF